MCCVGFRLAADVKALKIEFPKMGPFQKIVAFAEFCSKSFPKSACDHFQLFANNSLLGLLANKAFIVLLLNK